MKSFREFFGEKFFVDKMPLFLHLHEMAVQNDVPRIPVNIDEDDIEFLQQFPATYWTSALRQRYEKLFDRLESLHTKRTGLEFQEIKQAILQAMQTQNWGVLNGRLPDGVIQNAANKFSPENIKRYSKEELDSMAERIAFEKVKSDNDHVEEGGEEEFTFQQRKGKPVTIIANPFLNRLYHKVERTKDQPHDPKSGLQGQGKYGHDLSYPLRGKKGLPHTTRGMKFPTRAQIEERLIDFLNLNQHGVFGDLPNDVDWKPTGHKDTHTVNQHYDKFRKEFESLLKTAEPGTYTGPNGESWPPPGGWQANNDLEKAAKKLARAKTIEYIQQNSLKGPPIPGHKEHPGGIPITPGEGGELNHPPLHLPHQLKPVKVKDDNGQIRVTHMEVPVVKPAHYFRELGTEDSDFEREEDGRLKVGPDGKPIYTVPQDKLRGYDKKYVALEPEEYVKQRPGHKANAAFHFTHNSKGRQYVDKSDIQYDDVYEKIFGGQKKVLLDGLRAVPTDGASGYYEDIIAGILQCYWSAGCGGATGDEKRILSQNVGDVHQIMMMYMLDDLNNQKLLTSSGRKQWVKYKTGSYVQQDLGEGGDTRRKRKLTASARNASLNATKKGADGGTLSYADQLMTKMKDKERLYGSGAAPTSLSSTRGPGGRILQTGQHQFAYSVDGLRGFLKSLETEAQAADAASARARQASLNIQQMNTGVLDALRQGVKDKGFVLSQISSLLKDLYLASGTGEGEVTQIVDGLLKAWIEEEKADTAEKLVSLFEKHPLVVQALSGNVGQVTPDQQGAGMSEDEQEAIEWFQQQLEMMKQKTGMDLQNPQIKSLLLPKEGEQFSVFVQSQVAGEFSGPEQGKIMALIQKEINRLYGAASKPQQTAVAAREITPTAVTQKVNYAAQARDPQWLSSASFNDLLRARKGLLLNRANMSKREFDDAEHAIALQLYALKRQQGQQPQ